MRLRSQCTLLHWVSLLMLALVLAYVVAIAVVLADGKVSAMAYSCNPCGQSPL